VSQEEPPGRDAPGPTPAQHPPPWPAQHPPPWQAGPPWTRGREERRRDRSDRRFRSHRWHGSWSQDRRERPKPEWWPADEQWPPAGDFPWRRMRRLFFVRVAIGVALVVTLVVVGPILVLAQILSVTGLTEPASGVLAAALLVAVFLSLGSFGRGARRFAVPFGNLIEAAGRVEEGDYSARVEVPRRGWRELRVLTESFNSMAERLEADEEQRRTLLADVSHELRTPLAVLRGELEAMIDGVHPIDEAHLAAAVDQIGMLTKLVEDLRTLALADAGTLPMHPEPTDLSVLCNEVAASFESLAAEHGVRLELSMASDLPLIDVDALRIKQVVGNLVANALRYAPAGSPVSISARTASAAVEVRIADAGRGIDPELLPHLFERFAKSEDSRGSGLGLAIARRLVEAHGGTIAARRPEGGGTEILVTLPITAAQSRN
jgi:two-component system sensor histidine kinase BaeS